MQDFVIPSMTRGNPNVSVDSRLELWESCCGLLTMAAGTKARWDGDVVDVSESRWLYLCYFYFSV